MAKNRFDWEQIQAEYKAGQLTLRQIAYKHGCTEGAIRKKATQNSWERNLIDRVRVATVAKLLPKIDDDAAVDAAATAAADIIRQHRKSVRDVYELEQRLMGRIAKEEDDMTPGQVAYVMMSIATTQTKRIALERQAYNMDAKEDKNSIVDAMTDAELEQELGKLDD